MALTMGGAMGVVMMGWMWGMYADRRWNIGIIGGAVLLGVVATFLSQSQLLVEDPNYMRGMIPHHSIAILTSERADIKDLRVRELADQIIEAQRREIAEMEWLLADTRTTARRPPPRRPRRDRCRHSRQARSGEAAGRP